MSTTNSPNAINIEHLLILGSGLMGSGIAQVSAASGKFKSVVLQDISQEQLNKAKDAIHSSLKRVQKKDPSVDPEKVVSSITFSTEVKEAGVGNGLLILEAVPELLDLKQNIFKHLYHTYGNNDKVILATNTSSLPCRDIGVHVPQKEKFAGLHFFNPVAMMKLVEIIRVDEGTNDATYNALVQYVKDIKKVGITCKDTPGFIVNRLLIPYMHQAVEMVERGDASPEGELDFAWEIFS
jgi:3-hydroxyacyl-CoA dehydrogenase